MMARLGRWSLCRPAGRVRFSASRHRKLAFRAQTWGAAKAPKIKPLRGLPHAHLWARSMRLGAGRGQVEGGV